MQNQQNAPASPGAWIHGPNYRADLPYKKADLHLHSNYSYDVLNLPELSPRNLYRKAVAKEMGFFTLTDHETTRGIDALRLELEREYDGGPPIPVISGIEIKVRDPQVGHTVHVNVLGLDQRQMLELARRRKSLERFLEFCRGEDLYHSYNHPFWFERGEKATLSRVTSLIERFPIVELNAGRIPQLNGRTLEIARRFGKQIVATSDSHTGRVAKAYTMAPGETPEEFLRNVRDGVSVAVPKHASPAEFLDEVRDTIELVFLRQSAFRVKKTFLKQNPLARRIASTVLASEFVMRPWAVKNAVGKVMQVLAVPPVYAFILQQKRMHWGLDEVET
jgi:predicted metal-dependent phosphoesterase TrpH